MKVTIYVRLANENREARTLTFKPPEDFKQPKAVELGLAVDGYEYVADVSEQLRDIEMGDKREYRHSIPCPLIHTTLTSALACVQKKLLVLLEKHEVVFD